MCACLLLQPGVARVVPAALVALGITVLGLSAVNSSDALAAVLAGRSTLMYWAQTGLIAVYAVALIGLWQRTVQPAT